MVASGIGYFSLSGDDYAAKLAGTAHNRGMGSVELLTDAYGRIREVVHEAVEGLDGDALNRRIDRQTNSIAWLVWHLTRVQDDHVADVAEREQVWTADSWVDRFGLALPVGDIGYGHSDADVDAVRVSDGTLLTAYHDAVHERTVDYVSRLTDDDLDVVIDDNWDPPVTLGVRLVSVLGDDLQHAGQAAFLRGIADR